MKRAFHILPCMVLIVVGLGASRGDGKKPQEIKGWGTLIDPDGDCTLTEGQGKVTIKVPGTLHDLYPEQADPRKRFNAPRVLQEVKGDFVATVKVTADWKPAERLPGSASFPFNGAGLLVWGGQDEFVRLERNVWINKGPMSYTTPIQYKGNTLINRLTSTREEFYKGRSTWLRIVRAGDKLTTSISHDGKEWIETAVLTAKYAETVRLGIDAVNSSDKEFVVEFEEFKVEGKR